MIKNTKRFKRFDYIFFAIVLLSTLVMPKEVLIVHTFIELFTITIGFSLAIMAINNYKRSIYPNIIFIGIAYFFVGVLDIFHIFAYPDMPLFDNSGIKLASQFWIAARFMESICIFIAVKYNIKQSKIPQLSLVLAIATVINIVTIIQTDFFPSTYVIGYGLTNFKVFGEYMIVGILIAALIVTYKNKDHYKGYIFDYLVLAIMFSIASEITLTLYTDIYGISIAIGHGLKVLSFYMIYKGIVVVTINEPYEQMDKERIRFYTMFNKSNESIFLTRDCDKGLKILNANEKACQIIGGDLSDIIDKSFAELVSEMPPKHNALETIIRSENTFLFDIHLKSKFGADIYADISSTKINIFNEDIKIINIKDISLKKMYERDVFIYKSIVENSVEAIMVTDESNKIQWVNKSFEELYGYKASEILGRNPNILKSGEHDNAFYKLMWNSLSQKNYWIGELRNKRKDGSIVPIHESIKNIQLPLDDRKYFFSIMFDLTEKEENEAKVFKLAYIDPLTGLHNYHYIEDVISKTSPDMVFLVEIRNLNKIRLSVEKYVSDQVVLDLIDCIAETEFDIDLYKIDYNKILITFKKDKPLMQNEIILRIKELSSTEKTPIRIDIRISGVPNLQNECFILELINKAQLALEYFDRAHNDIYVEYDPSIESMILEDENILTDLKKAIDSDEIKVHYQPIVNQYTGEIVGAEALARWKHPEFGYIPPTRFIKIAEDNGMIIQLGYSILFDACKQFKVWLDQNEEISLNVNVSILQLQDPKFVHHVESILTATQFPPNRLILEITESSALENFEEVHLVMSKLNKLKVEFALDDFGTGFSSLSMLKQLPISYIKIDRVFIADINSNLQNSLLVSAIISMAHHLGLTVIIEGVETFLQALVIKNNHCRIIQGYYFSKPVEAIDFEKLLKIGFAPVNEEETISHEEKAEIDLEKQRFQSMHASTSFGVMQIDLVGKITSANQEAERILGYLHDELINKNIFDMFLDKSSKDFINMIINNDGVCDVHKKIVTKNGFVIELSLNSYIEYDWNHEPHIINCLIQDITSDIEKQMKLIRVREAYRKVFDESPIAIILWDSNYTITGWNRNAEITFGWFKNEIIGSKISSLITEEEFIEWKTQSEHLLSGIPNHKFMANRSKSSEIVICEWFNKPIYDDLGKVDFVLSIVKDVTSSRRQEQEVSNMREIIVSQERMAEIGQLVAGIAHEINNPLSYMISNSEMLDEDIEMYSTNLDKIKGYLDNRQVLEREEKLELYKEIKYWEEDLKEISESFKEGLSRIKEIVKGLKSFSWKGQKSEFEKYNINENISQVLIIARNELKYSTRVVLELDDAVPEIEAISNQINQVVLNMLINCKHAIESKFNQVLGEIKIKSWYDQENAYISVEDNGSGIEKSIIETIFEPFFTTKPRNVGTGLGLSISKSIIEENHNGKLYVESEVGVGTKFIIQLPIKQSNIK